MSEPFLGELRIMSFSFAPQGWALCNGQLLPINQNQALFSLLGTTFGGDGRLTFALPNLRGRVPVCEGPSFSLGQTMGESSHTISIAELPTHTHGLQATTAAATTSSPANALLATSRGAPVYGPAAAAVGVMSATAVTQVGGSQPHENRQPFLTLSICIALQGIFPSQN